MKRRKVQILKVVAISCLIFALCFLVACGISFNTKDVSTAASSRPTTPAASGDDVSTESVGEQDGVPKDSGKSGGSGCSNGSGSLSPGEETSGAAFSLPSSINGVSFNDGAAVSNGSAAIDVSNVSQGYAGAKASSGSRLKLQVAHNGQTYNYDMPNNGTAVFVPMNMGNGSYNIRIMQNTSGNNYVELLSTSANVNLADQFEPYLHPNIFCNFSDSSASTRQARELTSRCATQADALRAICNWVADNVKYDNAKAEKLANATGYIPNPDDTLTTKTGICFDYASLGAAMLRAVGIPAQVVTGYVSPNGLYHAWIMAYIDGTWHTATFTVNPKEWSRVDLTYAAAQGGNSYVGDGVGYEDRYTY